MRRRQALVLALTAPLAVLPVAGCSHTTSSSTPTASSLPTGSTKALALNYHRVRDMNPVEKLLDDASNNSELDLYTIATDTLSDQLSWLKDHDAHFLTLTELQDCLAAGRFPARSVWINFDDLDESAFTKATPVLKQLSVPATGFVITGQVGQANFNNLTMASREQLTQMQATGLWQFASHTHDLHYLYSDASTAFTRADTATITKDLTKSAAFLKDLTGTDVASLAYPYGSGTDAAEPSLLAAGFTYAFTLEDAVLDASSNHYYLPRIMTTEESFDRLVKPWSPFHDNP